MRTIRLEAVAGGVRGYVEIADFADDAMPDVVLWIDMVFLRTDRRDDHGRRIYVECFHVFSFTPSPGIDAQVPP